MAGNRRMRRVLRGVRAALARAGNERGIALPVTVMMLSVVSSVAFVTYKAAITSDDQARYDRSVKGAVAAADAGFDTALYRLNKMRPAPASCVVVNGDGSLGVQGVGSGTWCPALEEDLGDGRRFSYRMSKADSITSNG